MKGIFIALFLSGTLQAFTLINSAAARFPNDVVHVDVANTDCSNIGLTPETLLEKVAPAIGQFWNKVPTSRLILEAGDIRGVDGAFGTESLCTTYSPFCTANPALEFDSDILIVCNQNTTDFPNNSSVLAVTVPNRSSGRDIQGSIILINARSNSAMSALTDNQLIATLAHEIGHAIGLGHSPVSDSLMYYTTINNRQKLGLDDINGLSYLYPKEDLPLGVGGCGSIDLNGPTDGTGPGSFLFGALLTLMISTVLGQLRRRKRAVRDAVVQ